MSNYPLEIALVQKKQTFYINSHLVPVGKDDAPLLTYKNPESLSRYELVIINEDKKATTANVPVNEILRLQRISDYLYPKHLEKTWKPKTADDVIITSGKLKGRTPSQVLLEDADGKDSLRSQYKWLQDNLDKYPKNKIQMDAIVQAVKLFDEGKLEGATELNNISLYVSGMRPLTSRSVPDSLDTKFKFVYEITLEWLLGENVTVSILNYYAPVEKLPDGRLNVMKSAYDKATFIKNSMTLTADEWMNCLYNISMDMRRFEQVHAQGTYDESVKQSYNNRGN